MVAEQFKTYTANLEKFGQPTPETLPMMRELYVASDRESAFIESQPYLETKYAAYAAWGQDKALPGNESFSVPYQDLAKDRFLLGSPDEVAEEMLRYQDELGVNYLIFRMQWPGMPQSQVLETMQLFAEEVMPKVKKGA